MRNPRPHRGKAGGYVGEVAHRVYGTPSLDHRPAHVISGVKRSVPGLIRETGDLVRGVSTSYYSDRFRS